MKVLETNSQLKREVPYLERAMRLRPKQKAFADGVLEGMDPVTAYHAAGFRNSRNLVVSKVRGLLANPDIQEYIQWVGDNRPANAKNVRNAALVRLAKILADDKMPPMVHVIGAKVALSHWENTHGLLEGTGQDGMPQEYVEAIVRIRKKLVAQSDPTIQSLKWQATTLTNSLMEAGVKDADLVAEAEKPGTTQPGAVDAEAGDSVPDMRGEEVCEPDRPGPGGSVDDGLRGVQRDGGAA